MAFPESAARASSLRTGPRGVITEEGRGGGGVGCLEKRPDELTSGIFAPPENIPLAEDIQQNRVDAVVRGMLFRTWCGDIAGGVAASPGVESTMCLSRYSPPHTI